MAKQSVNLANDGHEKNQFTQEHIIGFIKQAEADLPFKILAAQAASATRPSTNGVPSAVARHARRSAAA